MAVNQELNSRVSLTNHDAPYCTKVQYERGLESRYETVGIAHRRERLAQPVYVVAGAEAMFAIPRRTSGGNYNLVGAMRSLAVAANLPR
jgi:hypothetical protein